MEKAQYILREAVVDDASQLTEIGRGGLPGYPFEYIYDVAAVAKEITAGADLRIVADSPRNGIMGTAVLELGGPMAEIKRVVVAPKMQRNGVASSMTQYLAKEAKNRGLIAWSDVRADQIGMQRSALDSGLRAICLEQGKHVVYQHTTGNEALGPAREMMVHMTNLDVNEAILLEGLKSWDHPLRDRLIANMEQALSPKLKDDQVIRDQLPSARVVKSRISDAMGERDVQINTLNDDIDVIEVGGNKLLVIKPDASGFILNEPNSNLPQLLDLSEQIGLQIVTCYSAVKNLEAMKILTASNMEPSMVRPWQPTYNETPRWEAGWRKTMNGYGESLHTIQLDEGVETPIRHFIDRLKIYGY